MIHRLLAAALIGPVLGLATLADEPRVSFNRDIRSLLSNHCLKCHGPDEESRSTELRLDTQEGSRIDLGGYAAIVPGDIKNSEILDRLTTSDPDLQMPPEGHGTRFSETEVDLIRRWIRDGADYDTHWSYKKPSRPALPVVQDNDWPKNAIDWFVLARMETAGLQPAKAANRLAIARRLALDLTGLPPTWDRAQAFVKDTRPNAYEIYVDSLLEQPAFGERWARVWLDLARYADSAGYADDPPRTIWAFRDYVIRSLNANKPFDQFTVEQVAGDLLDHPSDEQLTATAFHRNTLTNNEGGTNNEEFRNVAVVDRVNTTMAVWMGTTMACAQCHTHKYDPITQEEYFQLFAFFNNSEDADQRDERPLLDVWSDEQHRLKQSWTERIDELEKQLDHPTPELDSEQSAWLAEIQEQPEWKSIHPHDASSEHRQLSTLDSGWIQAEGDVADNDAYSMKFETHGESISALRLEISSQQTSNLVLSQASASWTPIDQNGIDARYVRIQVPGEKKMLHIAELQIFGDGKNLALDGKATQSSTGFGGNVSYANDGNTDGNFQSKSVTHTSIETDPWLEIDLGASQHIDQIVIWNRTDGGQSIIDRIAGYKVSLLGEDRETRWEQAPKSVPNPQATLDISGTIQLQFAAAFADHEQPGFAASFAIQEKMDPAKGWAIGGALGKPHELTLLLKRPQKLDDGILEVRLTQSSEHKAHLLNHFRFSATSSAGIAAWAQMPKSIREIVRRDERSDTESSKLASYFRSIAPSLADARNELSKLQKQLKDIKPSTTVPILRDMTADRRRTTKVQIRGNYLSTGNEVSEATPVVFHPLKDGERRDRLALARWLIDAENPLTARVIVNRHWEQLFGIGIVETSEEFGSQGELPTHPMLLDWIAVEFQESGWDLKNLIKLLVMSATYRQQSTATPELLEADPFNRLLARGPRFRISAEMVRDQALFVSGLLSDKMYGAPVNPPQPALGLTAAFGSTTDWKTSNGDDKYRRGIYTRWRRSNPYPSMATFDAPNREVCTIRRGRTNTPLQALVTLNDPVYVEAAQALAGIMMQAEGSISKKVETAFQRCLIRDPSEGRTAATHRHVRKGDAALWQLRRRRSDACRSDSRGIRSRPGCFADHRRQRAIESGRSIYEAIAPTRCT